MWGSLSLYLSDKNFSKNEQDEFMTKFGKEKMNKILSLLKISNRAMIDKKVENSFIEASNLLNNDKLKLINELKKIQQKTEGNLKTKTEIFKKFEKYLKS